MKRIFGLATALCLLGTTGALAGGPVTVTVMTRNLYVGTDTDLVLAASRSELPLAVAQAYDLFQLTQYEARMAAIAAEITSPDHLLPDLIGLQEASELCIQSPGDSLNPPPAQTAATDCPVNFVKTLLAKLEDLGFHYRVVASVKNVDLELPMAKPDGTYDDLRLIDYDVILARGPENCEPTPNSHECVDTKNAVAGNYSPAVHVQTATIRRGWVYVDADINGDQELDVRFASTHIEDIDTVRYAQTGELIRTLARTPLPLILVGDFNSKTSDDLAHRGLVAAGYTDHWPYSDDVGLTCCFFADLVPHPDGNLVPPFTERDDIIFTRNTEATGDSMRIGITPFQMSQPFWASDHAGVWAELNIP